MPTGSSLVYHMIPRRWKRGTRRMEPASAAPVDADPPQNIKHNTPSRLPVQIDTSSEPADDGSDGRKHGDNYYLDCLRPGGEDAQVTPPSYPPHKPTVEPLPPHVLQLVNEARIETDADVHNLIREINKNPALSDAQKSHASQAVHSRRYRQFQERQDHIRKERLERQKTHVSKSNVRDPSTGHFMLGCEHYPRNCKLKAKCCSTWVVCRQCHDRDQTSHQMNRFDTEEVMCMRCGKVQPAARACVNCNTEFARYFCAICKFYDNTPGKSIYHCPECGICRLGKGLGKDNFHCRRCDACVSKEYAQNHRCLQKSLDADCPICGQYLHSSTKPVVFMRCGHTMHSHCFDEYTAEHYTCPLCHKALTNMDPYYRMIDAELDKQQMPQEHRDKISEVLCHDCDRRSHTKYHFLYLRCGYEECRSYNTRLIRTFRRGEESSDSATRSGAGSSTMEGSSMHLDPLTRTNQDMVTAGDDSEESRLIHNVRDIVMSEFAGSSERQQEPVEYGSPLNDT